MIEVESIEDTLCEVSGHLNAQHARLVDATVWLLHNPIEWSGPGVWRADQYLTWRVGLSAHRARQIVEIAERVEELPVCVDAFRRGELSIDQMAAVAKRAPWWTDAEICAHAKVMTVRQLSSVLAAYQFPDVPRPDDPAADNDSAPNASAVDDDLDTPQPAIEPVGETQPSPGDGAAGERAPVDWCSFHLGDDGRFQLHLETDEITGRIIENALTEARDRLFHDGNPDVCWTDALREVCQRSVDAIPQSGRRNRFRINAHLDTTTGGVFDARGARIPDTLAKYLTCDGDLTPILRIDGVPVSVGRSERVVPDRTRRLVELRDKGCRVPGCTQHRWLDVHHIIHWNDHGPTDTWNLVCLCPHHHRAHHQGQLGIRGNADDPDGVKFTNGAGNPIAQTGAKPRPPGGPPPPPVSTYEHPLGERLDRRWIYYNPPPQHRPVPANRIRHPE